MFHKAMTQEPGTIPSWTTKDEIAFLTRLGRHREPFYVQQLSRKTLLARYRRTCARRHNWGRIEKGVIMTYVDMEIGSG